MFYKIGVLKNFVKTPKERPVLESFFNAVGSLKTATALKNYSSTGVLLGVLRNFQEQSAYHG